jgi:uncharacterized protein
MDVTRREFLKDATVGTLAASALLAGDRAEAAPPAAMPQRTLGRIGRKVSLLAFGMAPLGSDNSTPDHVERVVGEAIDQGVNYIDVAPIYGSPEQRYGNAEMKLKALLARRRGEVFLVTKVNNSRPDRDGVQHQLEESLRRMGTDHVDAVHIHNLADFDMDRVLGDDGALAGLRRAKDRGLTRHIGVSGHARPNRFARLLDTGQIDLTMVALNFADRHNYDFEGLVLPAARRNGTAIMAMKVLGGTKNWQYDGHTQAALADYHERAIRYTLGLPGVCAAVIGFNNREELQTALEVVRRYRPLSTAERAALLEEGKRIAQARGEYFGPTSG